jgi:DNA repair exonuclease SbcCD ATPase subunit
MNVILVIVIGILAIICGLLVYKLKEALKLKEIDTSSKEQYVQSLDDSIKYAEERIHNYELIEKDKLYTLDNLRLTIENSADNIKNLEKEFQYKNDSLKIEYNQAQQDYDSRMEELKVDIDNIEKELNSLKTTRASIIEAWRKEEEEKANQDFYRLNISDNDISDIKLLREIESHFSNPRIIAKLIWQTYFQPIAKVKFPMILGKEKVCGIYKITNILNDKIYIGQAKNVQERFTNHCKCGCNLDRPVNNKLYAAMVKDGLENFTFELLEAAPEEELNRKEKYYIDLYQSVEYGYNSQSGAE